MTMLLTEKTKQEKIINEAQKRRNLFGLGLTSLIAACGATENAAENAAENGATKVDIGTIPTVALTATKLTAVAAATEDDVINPDKSQSTIGQPVGRADEKQDLSVSINDNTRINGTGSFSMEFRNGDHTTASVGSSDYSITTRQGLVAADKYSLVVSSSKFGDLASNEAAKTGALYIVWNINPREGHVDAKGDSEDTSIIVPKYLKIAGVGGDTISAFTPTFYQIGGDKTAGGEPADQADLVFRSSSSINILWDVTKHATTADAGATNLTLTAGEDNGILQVRGGELVDSSFVKVNSNEDYDMIVKGPGDTHILWDVAEYHDPVKNVVIDLADTNTTGFLKIEGTGTAAPEFIKINNNDDYDMIVQGTGFAYILWDVANYHNAADAKAVAVSLTAPTATGTEATHGLLTITNISTTIEPTTIPKEEGGGEEYGYIDIDGGGINDIFFVQSDTYILFGEKLANRDGNGKAISHSIDLAEVAVGKFYDKDSVQVTDMDKADGDTVISGFFHFDLDGTGEEVQNVGYRFGREVNRADIKTEYGKVINPPPPADAPTLSEEVYWDIA